MQKFSPMSSRQTEIFGITISISIGFVISARRRPSAIGSQFLIAIPSKPGSSLFAKTQGQPLNVETKL